MVAWPLKKTVIFLAAFLINFSMDYIKDGYLKHVAPELGKIIFFIRFYTTGLDVNRYLEEFRLPFHSRATHSEQPFNEEAMTALLSDSN